MNTQSNKQRRAAQLEASSQINYASGNRGVTAFHQNGQVHTMNQNNTVVSDHQNMTPELYRAHREIELAKDKVANGLNINSNGTFKGGK